MTTIGSAVNRAMGVKSARVNFGFRPNSLSTSAKPERGDVGQERIAVGRSAGRELSADSAGGAGFRFDDDRLLDDRFERGGKRSRDDLGCPTGRERVDDGNGPRRIRALLVSHLGCAKLQAQT
jgi:hypothetical protein